MTSALANLETSLSASEKEVASSALHTQLDACEVDHRAPVRLDVCVTDCEGLPDDAIVCLKTAVDKKQTRVSMLTDRMRVSLPTDGVGPKALGVTVSREVV